MKETLSEFFGIACAAIISVAAFVGIKTLYFYILTLIV
jgi:hypothetical protein